jgi:hypothetical protein
VDGWFELHEPKISYEGHFDAKKNNIGPENIYFCNDWPEIFER